MKIQYKIFIPVGIFCLPSIICWLGGFDFQRGPELVGLFLISAFICTVSSVIVSENL